MVIYDYLKKHVKKLFFIIIVIVILSSILYLRGYRLSLNSAISIRTTLNYTMMKSIYNKKNSEIYTMIDIKNEKLYGDCVVKTYFFGILYNCERVITYTIDLDKPFMISGTMYGEDNKYYIGIKINDKKINSIAIGETSEYDLFNTISFDYIKKNPNIYKYSTNKNNYLVFSEIDYSTKSVLIMAFDKNGQLISYRVRGDKVKNR